MRFPELHIKASHQLLAHTLPLAFICIYSVADWEPKTLYWFYQEGCASEFLLATNWHIARHIPTENTKMTFSGTQDKCNACDKTVHFIDLLTADSIPYHKSCFRCSHCKGTLSVCTLLGVCTPWCEWSVFYALHDVKILYVTHELMWIVLFPDVQLFVHGWGSLLQDPFWAAIQGNRHLQEELPLRYVWMFDLHHPLPVIFYEITRILLLFRLSCGSGTKANSEQVPHSHRLSKDNLFF